MKRSLLFSALATLFLFAAVFPAKAAITVEQYTDPAAFKARLAGFPVKTVTFDSIKTRRHKVVAFPAEKFKTRLGMIITGEDGQYASRTFRLPGDFLPASGRNMYAPGPIDWWGTYYTDGGNATDVTFFAGDGNVLAAGFGCFFIDADYPGLGPSRLAIYDGTDTLLWQTDPPLNTGNRGIAFVGYVTVSDATDPALPIAAISRAHIVNGSGWAGNLSDNGEGVALDSFMAGTATFRVAGKVVDRAGQPLSGARVTLSGGGFTLRGRTNAKGRFVVPNVPAGTYDIAPHKSGLRFKPAKRSVVVDGDETVARFRQR